jgi:hypothetical protein
MDKREMCDELFMLIVKKALREEQTLTREQVRQAAEVVCAWVDEYLEIVND